MSRNMDFAQKISDLRREIAMSLAPLIDNDYIQLNVPFNGNIGDALIWQGECDFLSELPHRCLGVSVYFLPCRFPAADKDTVVLLHGGGHFGDLWRDGMEYILKAVKCYPEHKIILFPQSVWYGNRALAASDAAQLARHPNLTLCARDRWSYDFLRTHFSANKILLVPDMAFYINEARLLNYRNAGTGRNLFLKRRDKELSRNTPHLSGGNLDVGDWPTLEHPLLVTRAIGFYFRISRRIDIKPLSFLVFKWYNRMAPRFIRDSLLVRGCAFISPYSRVITTRLHGLILSVLLHKPVSYVDNTTGKISSFVHTWLCDLEGVDAYGTGNR